MKLRNLVLLALVALLAFPMAASAQSGFKVTGGGQTVPSEDYPGPGDTFGFNARATGPAEGDIYPASGQFNHIDRELSAPGDTHRGQGTHYKGIVTCLEATGPNSAQFGGRLREQGKTTDTFFAVDVVDNGQEGTDIIYYREVEPEDGDTPCDEDEDNDDSRLSRGNLQIHNNPEAS